MTQETTFNQEQALQKYSELMRLITLGSYEERQAHYYETDTFPADGVEEGIAKLDTLARQQGLEFVWDIGTKRWTLMPAMEESE